MRKILFFITFSVCHLCFGQQNSLEIQKIKKTKNMIENRISSLQDSVLSLNLKIEALEKASLKELIKDSSLVSYCLAGAKLRGSTNILDKVIQTFNNNEKIIILDYSFGYFGVFVDNQFGYMNEIWVAKNENIKKYIEIKQKEEERLKEIARQRNIKEKQIEEKSLISKYGLTNYKKLKQGVFWLGINEEMAIISLGGPDEINRTVGSWGVHSQWVYNEKKLYLYFENGKLTSYQD